MQRNSKDQPRDTSPAVSEPRDSPTIQNLIEQLDRDLKETERNASKTQ
jgi:hypothetical protein